jgi:hypothetical protein
VRFAFIAAELGGCPPATCCRLLGVSRSGFYARRDRPECDRRKRRRALAERIRAVHEENRRVYGSPRVYRVLRSEGRSVCENTVASVMREAGIRAEARRA